MNSGANLDLVPSVNINWPNRQGPIQFIHMYQNKDGHLLLIGCLCWRDQARIRGIVSLQQLIYDVYISL